MRRFAALVLISLSSRSAGSPIGECLDASLERVEMLVSADGEPEVRRPIAVPRSVNDYMAVRLRKTRRWELAGAESMVRGLKHHVSLLPAGLGAFVDVGSNLGTWAINFAHRGDVVIAVEPMARNRHALRATLCLNPDLRDRIKIVAAALGSPAEAAGELTCALRAQRVLNVGDGMLDCGPGLSCNSTAHPPAALLAKRQGRQGALQMSVAQWKSLPCEDVPVHTLAHVVSRGLRELGVARVGVMKIDVEGHECAVISGANFSRPHLRPRVIASEWTNPQSEKCMRAAGERWDYSHQSATGGMQSKGVDTNALQVDANYLRKVRTPDAT